MTVLLTAVRCARRRLHSEGGFTLAEILLVIVIGGTILGVLTSGFLVSAKSTSEAGIRLNESHDAQMVASYWNSDIANAQQFSKLSTGTSTCSAPTSTARIAMMSWTDTVAKDAFYYRPAGTDELWRRYCESNAIKSDIALAKSLGTTNPAVSCDSALGCIATPGWVKLTVTEDSGYSYSLRSRPRASSTGGGMGSYSIFVGSGGMTLSSSTTEMGSAGATYVGGSISCHASSTFATGNLTGSTSGDSATDCGDSVPPLAATIVETQSDPLAELPVPSRPASPIDPATTASTCLAGLPTYQPGTYTSRFNMNGCLASGLYYFDNGVDLKNVKAAPSSCSSSRLVGSESLRAPPTTSTSAASPTTPTPTSSSSWIERQAV